MEEDLECLLGLEKEVRVDDGSVAGVVCLLHLLLDHHELDLYQIEQRLYSLLRLFALLGLFIAAAICNYSHKFVDHHLVLNGLVVVANLEEVIRNLLVNVYLFFKICHHFQ